MEKFKEALDASNLVKERKEFYQLLVDLNDSDCVEYFEFVYLKPPKEE